MWVSLCPFRSVFIHSCWSSQPSLLTLLKRTYHICLMTESPLTLHARKSFPSSQKWRLKLCSLLLSLDFSLFWTFFLLLLATYHLCCISSSSVNDWCALILRLVWSLSFPFHIFYRTPDIYFFEFECWEFPLVTNTCMDDLSPLYYVFHHISPSVVGEEKQHW